MHLLLPQTRYQIKFEHKITNDNIYLLSVTMNMFTKRHLICAIWNNKQQKAIDIINKLSNDQLAIKGKYRLMKHI